MALDSLRPVKTIEIKGRLHRVESRECLYCGRFFETTYVNAKYCSRTCKYALTRDRETSRRQGVIHCLFCHTAVESADKRRKFCGPACRENMRKS